jgi:hypothetical protein
LRLREIVRVFISGIFAFFVLLTPFHGNFLRDQPIGAFGAFYCGGTIVRAGADPYRVEPLRSCEQKLPAYPNYGIAGSVEPVPLPGYAIAPFSLLSLLPFKAAFVLFSVVSVLATLVAVFALARLTHLTPLLIGAALLLGDLFHNLVFGEIPPLVIGALSLAGLFVSRKRSWGAAAALCVALVEPHVVLPAVIAVGVAAPAMRRPLLVLAAVLLTLTCAASGFHGAIEYVARVLPVQAAAELPAIDQYSLSWLLHLLGANDRLAVTLGSISYLCSAAFGVMLGVLLARRFEEPAFLVLFPPAIAMIGGSFLHDIQIPIAVPVALLLFARVPFARAWSVLAIALLAVPWSEPDRIVEFAAPVVAGAIVWESGLPQGHTRRAGAAFAAALTVLLLFRGLQRLDDRAFRPAGPAPASIARGGDAEENASENWFRYVRASGYGTSSPQSVAEKIPLWGGLLLIGAVGIGSLRRRSPCAAGDPEACSP